MVVPGILSCSDGMKMAKFMWGIHPVHIIYVLLVKIGRRAGGWEKTCIIMCRKKGNNQAPPLLIQPMGIWDIYDPMTYELLS